MRSLVMPIGCGHVRRAVADRAVRITDDYPADTTFAHAWMTDQVVRSASIRSMVVAPLINEDELMGALGVYTARPGRIRRAGRLARAGARGPRGVIARPGDGSSTSSPGSQQELARRVEQEATLRAITARIAVLQEPTEVLQRIVDESRRLLGADGAHLTLMSDLGEFLVPAVHGRHHRCRHDRLAGGAWSSRWVAASMASRRRSDAWCGPATTSTTRASPRTPRTG